MNPDQATELGKRVINTMRPTPALPEWQEVLTPLDLDDALVVFRELRDENDNGLTIARYLGAYRARLGARRARAEHDEFAPPPPRCELCDGTGWVDAPAERAHRPNVCRAEPGASDCWCTALDPCRCSRGESARDVHDRIARANDWRPANPDRAATLTAPSDHRQPSLLEDF